MSSSPITRLQAFDKYRPLYENLENDLLTNEPYEEEPQGLQEPQPQGHRNPRSFSRITDLAIGIVLGLGIAAYYVLSYPEQSCPEQSCVFF